jgi:GTP-binding protein EngB required for normal cell division
VIGSANSGKSSLINALNADTKIARTAKKSGKTQGLYFFMV